MSLQNLYLLTKKILVNLHSYLVLYVHCPPWVFSSSHNPSITEHSGDIGTNNSKRRIIFFTVYSVSITKSIKRDTMFCNLTYKGPFKNYVILLGGGGEGTKRLHKITRGSGGYTKRLHWITRGVKLAQP